MYLFWFRGPFFFLLAVYLSPLAGLFFLSPVAIFLFCLSFMLVVVSIPVIDVWPANLCGLP